MRKKRPINILITAGGTSEKIDNVRRITNSGTGRLGALVAEAFSETAEDCRIVYLCSATAHRPRINSSVDSRARTACVVEADDIMTLRSTVEELCKKTDFDIIVHSMAIGDYCVEAVSDAELMAEEAVKRLSYIACGDSSSPEEAVYDAILAPPSVVEAKIPSDKDNIVVVLKKAPKIISMLRGLAPHAIIVGFKLLSDVSEEELVRVGKALLDKNDCDYVLANDMRTVRTNRHEGLLINREGNFERAFGKGGIANLIVSRTLADCEENI